MRTKLVFSITIVTMTGAVMGLSPALSVLEDPSLLTMAGKTPLPCVQIARAKSAVADHL
jgi:hypothetical protein